VIFEPDLKIFGMKNKLDKDIVSLFEKRVYDLAGCTSDKVKVYLNEKEIKNVKEF
jgi:DNA topoisomerase-2